MFGSECNPAYTIHFSACGALFLCSLSLSPLAHRIIHADEHVCDRLIHINLNLSIVCDVSELLSLSNDSDTFDLESDDSDSCTYSCSSDDDE